MHYLVFKTLDINPLIQAIRQSFNAFLPAKRQVEGFPDFFNQLLKQKSFFILSNRPSDEQLQKLISIL